MLQNILFQLLALISNIVTQPGRQASFHTVWNVFDTALLSENLLSVFAAGSWCSPVMTLANLHSSVCTGRGAPQSTCSAFSSFAVFYIVRSGGRQQGGSDEECPVALSDRAAARVGDALAAPLPNGSGS